MMVLVVMVGAVRSRHQLTRTMYILVLSAAKQSRTSKKIMLRLVHVSGEQHLLYVRCSSCDKKSLLLVRALCCRGYTFRLKSIYTPVYVSVSVIQARENCDPIFLRKQPTSPVDIEECDDVGKYMDGVEW